MKNWDDSYKQTLDDLAEAESFVRWYLKEYYEWNNPDPWWIKELSEVCLKEQNGDTMHLDGVIDSELRIMKMKSPDIFSEMD